MKILDKPIPPWLHSIHVRNVFVKALELMFISTRRKRNMIILLCLKKTPAIFRLRPPAARNPSPAHWLLGALSLPLLLHAAALSPLSLSPSLPPPPLPFNLFAFLGRPSPPVLLLPAAPTCGAHRSNDHRLAPLSVRASIFMCHLLRCLYSVLCTSTRLHPALPTLRLLLRMWSLSP